MPVVQDEPVAEPACADEGGDAESPRTGHFAMTGMPLPPPKPQRWVPHRKAEVMAAVTGGFLSLEDALERYALTIDEYLSWQRRVGQFGMAGLRVNGPQPRRRAKSRPPRQ